jgi:uncharacterized lipoprotein YddW (UPF0748 family)
VALLVGMLLSATARPSSAAVVIYPVPPAPETTATSAPLPASTPIMPVTPSRPIPVAGVTATPDGAPAVDYLWVLRNSLVEAADVPRVIARAKAMGVRGLLVQVVGRGDAWYRSDLLPAPEPMRGEGRDPLGELLPLAHAAGLEVHAWVNCCLVWSGSRSPRSPRHVLNAHPEWVARLSDGRSMTRLSARQIERLRLEGVFLAPGHPGVQRWLAEVVQELVARYPVDGVHLDYIRQPGVEVGYDPTTRSRFALEHGADPMHLDRQPPALRAHLDSLWEAFQEAQVTAVVRGIRDSVNVVRPGLPLSAAVVADSTTALTSRRQAWGRWLRDGLLDRAFLMCYAPPVGTVLGQMTAAIDHVGADRVVPGIAMYNTPLSTAATKIKAARALGFPAVALYSYDSLYERPASWERLRALLTVRDPLEVHP